MLIFSKISVKTALTGNVWITTFAGGGQYKGYVLVNAVARLRVCVVSEGIRS